MTPRNVDISRNRSKMMNKIWSDVDKQFVKDNAGKMKDSKIAEELTKRNNRKVSLQAVRKQRQKLGLNKKPGRGICALVEQEKIQQPMAAPTPLSGVPANVAL